MAPQERIDRMFGMLIGLARRLTSLARLGRDERGNVLLLGCCALIPITTAIGMVMDYSSAARLRTKLATVADAAALAAITTPMMQQPMSTACGAARRMFVNGSSGLRGLVLPTTSLSNLSVTITETYSNAPSVTVQCPAVDNPPSTSGAIPTGRSITVAYNGQSQNTFARLLGMDTLAIGGSTGATASTTPFIDIHLALDTSQSMGLASTDAGAQQLWTQTKKYNGRGCQFGCHGRDPHEPYSMEAIAKYFGIELRVDVERKAALDMIDTARSLQGPAKNYQFGIYRIGPTTEVIQTLTNDLDQARSSVSTLDLRDVDGSVGPGDTNLPDLTSTMNARIPARGDGSSRTAARSFLFIVTDGVTDLCGSNHCTSVIDPATCQAYKDQKITVGVVYTTYLPVLENPTDPNNRNLDGVYRWLVEGIAPNISPALKACASDGWFFEASDSAGIHAAMQKLFDQATRTATIVR